MAATGTGRRHPTVHPAASFALALALATSPRVCLAYEVDVHYYATFALALVSGWSWNDARVIASADQAVDENKRTVAALDTDVAISVGLSPKVAIGVVHQAPQNFLLHSFSPEDDRDKGLLFAPVACALEQCGKRASDLLKKPIYARNDAADHARTLIAIGVYMHCYEDMASHYGYGDQCPPDLKKYPGSCMGHTVDSLLERLERKAQIFRKPLNPDNPIVKPLDDMRKVFSDSAGTLASSHEKLYGGADHSIEAYHAAVDLPTMVLRDPGVDALPDEQRIECNRERIGAWLYDRLEKTGRLSEIPKASIRDTQGGMCGAGPAIIIPDPRYPRLDGAAAPVDVQKTGQYVSTVDGNTFDYEIEDLKGHWGCSGLTCTLTVTLRVENLGKSDGGSALALIALLPNTRAIPPLGARVEIGTLKPQERREIQAEFPSPVDRSKILGLYASIEPMPGSEGAWLDANVGNDSLACGSLRPLKDEGCSATRETPAR